MSSTVVKLAAFFVIWLMLTASLQPIHLILGAVVTLVVWLLNPAIPSSGARVSWVGAVLYAPWLLGRIFMSGLRVTRLILDPSMPIAPTLIHHRPKLDSDLAIVALGNSITLTPGTITLEASRGELVVHAIDEVSGRDLTEGHLERKLGQVYPPAGPGGKVR